MTLKEQIKELQLRLHVTMMAFEDACGGDWDKIWALIKKHAEPYMNQEKGEHDA